MPKDWQGVLLEHWIHHELKAFMRYTRPRGTLGFWRTPSGSEVDFVWWYGDRTVAIEVKSAKEFRRSYLKGISSLGASKPIERAVVVYMGNDILKYDNVEVLPVIEFLKRLWAGEVIEPVSA